MRMQPSTTTSRLDLSSFEFDDVAELHECFSDPQTHTIGNGPFRDIEQTEAWIERRIATYRDCGLCWYALRERSTGRLVGNCGILLGRTGAAEPEIGYEIRYDSRGRGYAAEAVTAVMAECARAGVGRVWATVRPANAASLRVLDRIGMTLDHTEEDTKGALLYLSRIP
jgi:RimJ/RimL family protein N-acetyltransferase